MPALLVRDTPVPRSVLPPTCGPRRTAFAMAHTGVGSSGIGHAHTINRVRHHQLRPFFEQPCCRLGVLFVNALSNGYMLGPAVGVGALDQYFIRGELEVSMCQMDREPLQLAVPGERITDIRQARSSLSSGGAS
jgi:hypothetical protein